MKKFLILLIVPLWILMPQAKSQALVQDTNIRYFSMQEARAFASENNYDVINALKEIEKARQTVKETTSIGLPQISGSVAYTDFIDIPTQLIPAEFLDPTNPDLAGTYFPVQFGTKYNMSASLSASQLIFSGEYIVGLQASRVFVDFSERQYDKMVIDLDRSVAESYYMVLIAERNKIIIDSTLASLMQIRNANQVYYENGFLEDTDVDQIDLLISDLNATLIDIQNNLEVSRNLLKFTMGLKLENDIVLTDNLTSLLEQVDKTVLYETPFDYRKNIDYKILENQQELAYLDMKRYKSQYLPRMYAFFNFQENAYRQEWNFFESGQDWFKTTLWGVQLDIPIFESGARSSKINKAKIQIDQLEVMDQKLRSGLEIQVSTVRNNFLNSWKVYQNKESGLALSLKIYRKTQEKLLEGVSSTIELQQNYNQYLNSESDYVMSILQLLSNKLELEQLLTQYKD
jgi:outer membrane protein TolC